jgi:hypothetical protein
VVRLKLSLVLTLEILQCSLPKTNRLRRFHYCSNEIVRRHRYEDLFHDTQVFRERIAVDSRATLSSCWDAIRHSNCRCSLHQLEIRCCGALVGSEEAKCNSTAPGASSLPWCTLASSVLLPSVSMVSAAMCKAFVSKCVRLGARHPCPQHLVTVALWMLFRCSQSIALAREIIYLICSKIIVSTVKTTTGPSSKRILSPDPIAC